jgi:hypothetical protein
VGRGVDGEDERSVVGDIGEQTKAEEQIHNIEADCFEWSSPI